MNGTRRIVLLRHGRTAWNVQGRFQGQADPPLDAVGWRQAAASARALCAAPVVAVLSSDLTRAQQTAEAAAAEHGLRPVVSADLREVNLGAWTGLTHAEALARFPDEYRAWKRGEPVRRGGGETEREAGLRLARRLHSASAAIDEGGALLLVSHGVAMQAAMAILQGAGTIDLRGDPPHLANGQWVNLGYCGWGTMRM